MSACNGAPPIIRVSTGAVLAVVACVGSPNPEHEWSVTRGDAEPMSPPLLFGQAPDCTSRRNPGTSAEHAERNARHREKRYPYDPRDGIHAVEQYALAEVCYGHAARPDDAARTNRARQRLAARVDTDYAALRLRLARAIEAERWEIAHRVVHRLRLLTEHLRGHQYVEWLDRVSAKAYSEVKGNG